MGSDVWSTRLELDEPGSMPLSCVAPLYDGLVAGFGGRQLARVVLKLLGLKPRFLVCIERLRRLVGTESNTRCALDLFIHASNVDSARADPCTRTRDTC